MAHSLGSDFDVDEGGETDEEDYEGYYNQGPEDCEVDSSDPRITDPEFFEYECFSIEEVEKLLNEAVEILSTNLQVTPSLAKLLLHSHSWAINDILQSYKSDSHGVLVESRIKPPSTPNFDFKAFRSNRNLVQCPVCLQTYYSDTLRSLSCGHFFCKECWEAHFEIKIWQGITTVIECMAQDCNLLVPEDFVLGILSNSGHRERYQQFAFSDYVKSHPELRFCPGPNCCRVVRAKELRSKRAICKTCKTSFCFKCGVDYHAPTDCDTIKKWLTKCADDSETANYISAHTKDCPKCHICIEKNGGCNHMQCYSCKHDFCWMCLGGNLETRVHRY